MTTQRDNTSTRGANAALGLAPGLAVAFGLVALLLAAGCDSSSDTARNPSQTDSAQSDNTRSHAASPDAADGAAAVDRESTEAQGKLIRLVERLGSAQIDSPLMQVPEATDVAAIEGELARETILDEDFADFSPERYGWPARSRRLLRGQKPGRESGAGREAAFCFRGQRAYAHYFLLPAQPQTHYRFVRSARAAHSGVDWVVAEMDIPLAHPTAVNHPADRRRLTAGRFVRAKHLLYVHRFAPITSKAEPRRDAISVHTHRRTRAFVLMLQDAQGAAAKGRGATCFHGLRAERLEPNAAQQLSLLKAQDRGPKERALPWMGKHGQFLPLGDAETVAPPFDRNFDFRDAIFAPAPTRMRFELELPREARLDVALALHEASQPGDGVRFQVAVQPAADTSHEVLREQVVIGPERKNWHWHEQRVDLSRWSGEKVSITLSTTAVAGGRGYALWGNPVVSGARESSDPPNVLLIGVDTLRADRLGGYGHARATSPEIDALAADGTLFEKAISTCNWTTPAFASMFTGLMPSRHRVTHRTRAIAPQLRTLAERFRAAGWLTHGVAYKAYLYNMGFEQGFDTWFNVPRAFVKGKENVGRALSWLDRNHDRRFFLFLHLNDPHQPFNQPQPFDRKFNDIAALRALGMELPVIYEPDGDVSGCARCTANGRVVPRAKKLAHDLYDGEVAYTDALVGRVVAALKKHGIYDDTVVAFISDHGEVLWEHDGYFGHGGPRMPDELLHVPFVIKPAATDAPAGQRIAQQVSVMDLMPTLLGLAGVQGASADVQGRNLTDLVQGTKTPPTGDKAESRLVISETEGGKRHIVSVRGDGWKYILYIPRAAGAPLQQELFRLDTAAGEHRDVLQQHPDVAAERRRAAVRFLLANRAGTYLLVRAPKRAAYTVAVSDGGERPVNTLYPIFGRDLQQRAFSKARVFRGRAARRILLLARVSEDNGAMRVTLNSPGAEPETVSLAEPTPFAADGVDAFLQQLGAGALLIRSEAAGAAPGEVTKMSADKRAVLKALGYIR